MSQASYDFLVGTFDTPHLYTLRFTPALASPPTNDDTATATASTATTTSTPSKAASLEIVHRSPAVGSHSWLHLNPPPDPSGAKQTRNLYATAWTEPPSVVAYAVASSTEIRLLGSAPTRSRSGYVCASDVAVYSAGGATGEVFGLDATAGNFAANHDKQTNGHVASPVDPLQTISFLDSAAQRDDGSVMDFGGLRHGAHSADLSPDGRTLYVADIGRNCIWVFGVGKSGVLTLAEKHVSPRPNDGPRHVWPHPGGKYVYCVQEHTSMVDVFATQRDQDGVTGLKHGQGVRIIPAEQSPTDFWADEVRTSLANGDRPKYLYASTRGLTPDKKGYVAVFKLTEEGMIDDDGNDKPVVGDDNASGIAGVAGAGLLCMYETPTSGGWANAVQPGPTVDGVEYLALTDSEQGWVFVLAWDGRRLLEVARTRLDDGAGAATAVWL